MFIQLGSDLLDILNSVDYFLPEIVACFLLFLLVVTDLLLKSQKGIISAISITGFLILIVSLAFQWQTISQLGAQPLFLETLLLDKLAIFLKIIAVFGGLFTVLLSVNYGRKDQPVNFGEYHTLIYGLVLGAMLLSMSQNLLMTFVAIEFISICSYILVNFNFGKRGAEASLKYLLFGAVSSAVMLYGMSLLYGFTGTLGMAESEFAAGLMELAIWPFYLAVFMTISGFIFKLGAVPFHVWAPDIYQGAPVPIVALFSTVPKIVASIVLFRFLASLPVVTNLFWISPVQILAFIAIASMLVGNLSALSQTNAKRMMAYSSIAHAGFMLSGIVAYSRFGLQSLLFYAVVFFVMNFAAFLIIKMCNMETGNENMKDFAGWGQKYPFIAISTVVVMISLTGLPPTAGFTAKLLIFSAVWEAYQTNNDVVMLILFIVGLLNTVLAVFYYIKIPYYMFFRQARAENTLTLQSKNGSIRNEKYLLGILIFPLLFLFFKSSWLTDFIKLVAFEF